MKSANECLDKAETILGAVGQPADHKSANARLAEAWIALAHARKTANGTWN